MANITTSVTTTILGTAGVVPDVFGSEIVVAANNASVMLPAIRRYPMPPGETLTIPLVGTRSATSRTRGTDDTELVVFNTIDDTGPTMSKRFAYDALALSWATLNDMTPAQTSMYLAAEQTQMAAALANQIDTDTLGLYSSATTNSVGSSGVDVDWALIIEAIGKLRTSNAPPPYYIVCPETQWDHLAAIPELTRADAIGTGDTILNRQTFRAFGVTIMTTGNVPTSGGAAQGLAFSGEGIAIALRTLAQVEEWRDPRYTAQSLMVWSDYAYANTIESYMCKFTTTDT